MMKLPPGQRFCAIIDPLLQRATLITHLTFGGLDGHRSVVAIEDALADDVLIAQQLNGRPLDGDHGTPARLVSPRQYGYISTKHLCRIGLHSGEPTGIHAAHSISRAVLRLTAPFGVRPGRR